MPKTSVFAPLFEDGLQSINFFNGRLLSAEDLTTERDATRQELRRLGLAIGDGIVSGLEVRQAEGSTADQPAVTVMPGVAINRYGDTINLPKETDVSLLTAKSQPCGAVVKVFAECKPPKAGTYRTGAGVYLLAIRPASGGTGLAPVSGLGNDLAGCNTRYLVEGVRFVLAELPLAEDVLNDTARLRNRAAYACFGVQQEAALAADPFGAPPAESTAIDTLRASGDLTTCSVPLALVYWTTGGVEFVDTWAARRRAARRTAPIGTWDAATDWRRVAQAEARLQQFQQHVRMLLDETSQPGTLNAARCFRYLPPVGLLRIGGVRTDGLVIRPNASLPATAFNFDSFFGGRVHPAPVFIEGAHLAALVRDSIAFPPIDVEGEEMVRLYVVRENVLANGAAQCLVFASGYMRPHGAARYDVARWSYSNYV